MRIKKSFKWFKHPTTFFLFGIIIIVIFGVIFIKNIWDSTMKSTTQNALTYAIASESGFQDFPLNKFDLNLSDIEKPEYQELKENLTRISKIRSDIRFVYIYTLINDKIYFVADSEPYDSEDYSPPGQEFTEATEYDKMPFKSGETIITNPLTDRWGTWISVLVPIKDFKTGNITAVFGIDYPVKLWYNNAIIIVTQLAILLLFAIIVYIAIYNLILKNKRIREDRNKIDSYMNRLNRVQAISQVGNWEITLENKQLWISDEVYKIFDIKRDNSSLNFDKFSKLIGTNPNLDNIIDFILKSNDEYNVISKIKREGNGEKRIIQINAIVEYDKNRIPYKIMGVIQDITELWLTNISLKEKNILFNTLFEQSPFGIALCDDERHIVNCNPMFLNITGVSAEEYYWEKNTHPDDLSEDIDNFNKLKNRKNNGYTMKKRYIKPDGSIVWVNITITPIKNEQNRIFLCLMEDITERIKAEQDLKESARSNAVLLSNLPGMAYRCDYNKNYTMRFVSNGCFELTGYTPEHLLNNNFIDLIMPEYRDEIWESVVKNIESRSRLRVEYPIISANGGTVWVLEQSQGIYDADGNVTAIEGLIIDITDRKNIETNILYLSNHDALTGLYNRRYFEEEKKRLDNICHLPLSIIIGDINGLKLINDSLGHYEGDKLIKSVAKILSSCCRDGDILARTGGDEFSILLPNTSNDDAYKILKNIQTICEKYRKINTNEPYQTYISLGCSTKNSLDEKINVMMRSAEEHMYRHKLLQSKSFHSSIISSMKTTMLENSQETEEHAQRLVFLSKAIGQKMGLSDEQLNELELLSTLHDIGKIGVSDSIINKTDRLNVEELQQMKKHPEIGYRIALSIPELAPIADYILCHHERWDGNGYPGGLVGKAIPLLSRIITIVDAFDAMTQDRSYRKAISTKEAIEEIKNNLGTQFDPVIGNIFINMIQNEA